MYPQLFSMIAPNLFQGGTDDLDVIHLPVTNNRKRTDLPFDAIVTMYAWARPADWNVQEFRYGVPMPQSTISILLAYAKQSSLDTPVGSLAIAC